MSRKQKLRYLLAIYLVVAFAAIILGFIAFNQKNTTWQSLLLNLSTELLGVVFVFLLVNVVFLLGDWDLSDQVNELIQKLKNPSAKDFFKKSSSPEDLRPYIQEAQNIDWCGVSLTTTINRTFTDLFQRLTDGANIRIMIIAPTKENLQAAAKRSESGSVKYYEDRLEAALGDIQHLYRKWQDYNKTHKNKAGKLAIGLLPYTPSFGLLSFTSVKNRRVIMVEMYPHHKGYERSPHFILNPETDDDWIDYFAIQFEEMWDRTTPWSPDQLAGKKIRTKKGNGG